MKTTKIKRRWKNHFGRGSIISGAIALLLSWILFNFVKNPFWSAAHESLTALGLILIIAGLIYTLVGKRLEK